MRIRQGSFFLVGYSLSCSHASTGKIRINLSIALMVRNTPSQMDFNWLALRILILKGSDRAYSCENKYSYPYTYIRFKQGIPSFITSSTSNTWFMLGW
jgi:hypothetical protein